MNTEGGELGTGAGIFPRGVVSAQWLGDRGGLECGWTEGEVGWGGGGQRQGAGTLAKGPEAQGHKQFTQNRGLGWYTARGPPTTLVQRSLRPLLLNGPGNGETELREQEKLEE